MCIRDRFWFSRASSTSSRHSLTRPRSSSFPTACNGIFWRGGCGGSSPGCAFGIGAAFGVIASERVGK
eukprot:7392262-Alexandrium_andersonii.AAC.1